MPATRSHVNTSTVVIMQSRIAAGDAPSPAVWHEGVDQVGQRLPVLPQVALGTQLARVHHLAPPQHDKPYPEVSVGTASGARAAGMAGMTRLTAWWTLLRTEKHVCSSDSSAQPRTSATPAAGREEEGQQTGTEARAVSRGNRA